MPVSELQIVRAGLVPYEPTWQLQREVHAAVADGTREDTVLLCEHEDVYTAGKRTATWDRPVDGTPVVDVDRGGRITWHGPGQLVGYPIVKLATPIDVVRYVRVLEEALIRTCATTSTGSGSRTIGYPTSCPGPCQVILPPRSTSMTGVPSNGRSCGSVRLPAV